ncbi:hypothetical protein GCM10010435_16020 [Winogradskya consettensis]|uniref:Secreted protein n=1 Tax=Winogradskya consettensis TaxID=113560 RepID=A0A919SB99_9ACTN|nr:hypothetical protein [Actinoplanes consettensis]GIM69425.1 hypothetical protein Aco04nite_15290 [Actinoplanes consettensis]
MVRKLMVVAAVVGVVAGGGLASPAQASGAKLYTTSVVTNAAKSARIEGDVWIENDTGKIFTVYQLFDLNADGYAPRGRTSYYQGSKVVWVETSTCSGGVGKVCDHFTTMTFSPKDVSSVEVEVWNGPNGPHVSKHVALP